MIKNEDEKNSTGFIYFPELKIKKWISLKQIIKQDD